MVDLLTLSLEASRGHKWQYFQCDPYTIAMDMVTGQVPMWYPPHPDHGMVCNFPVPLEL
jgi:hypothetical protein